MHCFNPLIVWNNTFGVDDPFTKKPVDWFAQAETENYQSQILSKDADTFLKISFFLKFALLPYYRRFLVSGIINRGDDFNVKVQKVNE